MMTWYDKLCLIVCYGLFLAGGYWLFVDGFPMFQSYATIGEVPTKVATKIFFVICLMVISRVVNNEIHRKYP